MKSEKSPQRLISSAANRPPCRCATRPDSASPAESWFWRGLVDTSGYASDVQAKYQGLLITEVKLDLQGTELPPGQYGFGFSQDGEISGDGCGRQ